MKSASFRRFLLGFWEERGEKLMTCHLFLDNFSWNFMTFGLFSKVKSFWNGFLFQMNSNIVIMKLWDCLSERCLFSRKTCYCRNLIVFSCLQFADCYIWPLRIFFSCGVILCVNHCYGVFFWKVSFKKSWRCRKHVLVFEIVSLKGLKKFWSNYLFPLNVG